MGRSCRPPSRRGALHRHQPRRLQDLEVVDDRLQVRGRLILAVQQRLDVEHAVRPVDEQVHLARVGDVLGEDGAFVLGAGGVEEEEAVESVGGRLAFTDDITFSSSNIINNYFDVYPDRTVRYLNHGAPTVELRRIIVCL